MKKGIWSDKSPSSETSLQNLLADSKLNLPKAYLDYLRESNGGEGDISISPYWLQLWKAEEVIKNNEDYEVKEYVPNFFVIGSSGGGEMIAFKINEPNKWSVYSIPFIPMEEDAAIMIAKNFEEFSKAIGQETEE